MEHRSIQRQTSIGDMDQFETNYHVDAWQNIPNVGQFSLWLDWANASNADEINRLGRGTLSLKGFRYHDSVLNGLVGDSSMRFTNLPQRFSNSTYADIYFRGIQSDLSAKWGEGHIFGGQVARLKGLLGRIYDPTEEIFYGFKGHFRPFPRLLFGAGFIRTENEVDIADEPVTRNNHIFLCDTELQIFKWMKWLTEIRGSDFAGEPGVESQRDYALKFGPILETGNLRLEANYRRIGADYRFVNEATQVDRDEEGFFLLADYRPLKQLTLFGNLDRHNDNVAKKSDRNITDTLRALTGLSFFSPKYPSLFISFDMADRKTRLDFPSPADNLTATLFTQVQYRYKDFNPYIRYRRVAYSDEIKQADEYVQNNIVIGLRQYIKHGTFVYIEGEADRKEYQEDETVSRISGKLGLNYFYSPRFFCWAEAIYSKLKDRAEDSRRDKIEGSLGLSYELPWDTRLYTDIRYDKVLDPQRHELESQGLQFTIRLARRFGWGRPEKVAGLKPGVETKGHGLVEGLVFNDINGNGFQEKEEEGIKDVIIRLEDGSIVKTDEKGFFQFSRVEVGGHLVTLDVRRIPADYSIVSPEKVKVEVKLRETARVNFQLIATARIEGRVINDTNGNGKFDPDEKGIPDVLVILQLGENNTYTDEEGKFIFENVLPGEYILKLDPATLPEDAIFTSPSEIKFQVPVGGELKDMNFLIHVKPRPIIMGPQKG